MLPHQWHGSPLLDLLKYDLQRDGATSAHARDRCTVERWADPSGPVQWPCKRLRRSSREKELDDRRRGAVSISIDIDIDIVPRRGIGSISDDRPRPEAAVPELVRRGCGRSVPCALGSMVRGKGMAETISVRSGVMLGDIFVIIYLKKVPTYTKERVNSF